MPKLKKWFHKLRAPMIFSTGTTWAVVVLTSCSKQSPPPQQSATRVTAEHPVLAVVTNWDEYPGHLEAVQMVEIRPRVSGYLDSIHFKDGTEVNAGDLLFTIDAKPYKAALEQAVAMQQSAWTRVELASNDWERAENLFKNHAISAEELDSRSKAMQTAEASFRAANAAVDATQVNVDYTQIKAPISGKIGQRMITIGNLVQDGGSATLMATLVSLDPIYCYFTADERAYLRYRAQGDVTGSNSIPCELGLANENGFPHQGHVDFFNNQVDPTTGTIEMRAVFSNEDRSLVPGLFARVRVPAGPPTAELLVSDVAIQSDQDHKFVYVVAVPPSNSVAQVRPVQLNRHSDGFWQVTKGLTTNDNVIVNGLLMVRPGVPVDTAPPPTPGMAAQH